MSPESRHRTIFRKAHARHPRCLADEWLAEPCRDARGRIVERPVVWSRRNGPWRRVDVLLVGAAPGNAGGKGAGGMGAHGTRIPFGGDIAGGNLDVLLAAAGLTRDEVFIVAALNQLPAAGGGEPSLTEMLAPVGEHPSSLHLLRDTVLASGARLLVALGNVGLRASLAAPGGWVEPASGASREGRARRLPTLARIARTGVRRGEAVAWPDALAPDPGFLAAWREAWPGQFLPRILWLTHPSAQNMSPYAGRHTRFYQRMIHARDALCAAVEQALGRQVPAARPPLPTHGTIYSLPDWTERVGPRHAEFDRLWRERGI